MNTPNKITLCRTILSVVLDGSTVAVIVCAVESVNVNVVLSRAN